MSPIQLLLSHHRILLAAPVQVRHKAPMQSRSERLAMGMAQPYLIQGRLEKFEQGAWDELLDHQAIQPVPVAGWFRLAGWCWLCCWLGCWLVPVGLLVGLLVGSGGVLDVRLELL